MVVMKFQRDRHLLNMRLDRPNQHYERNRIQPRRRLRGVLMNRPHRRPRNNNRQKIPGVNGLHARMNHTVFHRMPISVTVIGMTNRTRLSLLLLAAASAVAQPAATPAAPSPDPWVAKNRV